MVRKLAIGLLAILAASSSSAANPDVATAAVERCLAVNEAPASCIGVYAIPCEDRLRQPRYAASAEAYFAAIRRFIEATEQCAWDEITAWDSFGDLTFDAEGPTDCPAVETKFRGARWGLPDPTCRLEEHAQRALKEKGR